MSIIFREKVSVGKSYKVEKELKAWVEVALSIIVFSAWGMMAFALLIAFPDKQ